MRTSIIGRVVEWIEGFAAAFSAKAVRNTLLILFAVSLFSSFKEFGKPEKSRYLILGDGAGYYAYLPNIFFYQDWTFSYFSEVEKKYWNREGSAYFLNGTEHGMVDKYFCGVAVLLLPFYLIAWLLSALFGYDCDGYSHLFCLSVSIGAITYVLLGMHLLSRILLKRFSQLSVAAAIAAIYLGTNLFYYTIVRASYSHAYSFAAICVFIYLVHKSIKEKTLASYLLVSLCFGIILLLRPANGLVIFSVFGVAPNIQELRQWVGKFFSNFYVIPAIILFASVVFLQSYFYHLQQGVWWVFAYGNEGFNFANPEILNVLWSYRAGFFIWSPVTFVALFGIIFLYKKFPIRAISFVGFFLLVVFITSSWWAWHYEGTYGMRPLVDYLGYFVVLLCFLFDGIKSRLIKVGNLIVVILLVMLVQVQTLQQIRVVLPWSNMTKEKYWYIFLETQPKFAFFLADPDYPSLPKNSVSIEKFKAENSLFENQNQDSLAFEYNGLGNTPLMSFPFQYAVDSLKLYLDLNVEVKIEKFYRDQNIEVKLFENGVIVRNELMSVMRPHYKTSEWQYVRIAFMTDKISSPDSAVVSVMNTEKEKVEVKSIHFSVYEILD